MLCRSLKINVAIVDCCRANSQTCSTNTFETECNKFESNNHKTENANTMRMLVRHRTATALMPFKIHEQSRSVHCVQIFKSCQQLTVSRHVVHTSRVTNRPWNGQHPNHLKWLHFNQHFIWTSTPPQERLMSPVSTKMSSSFLCTHTDAKCISWQVSFRTRSMCV